MIVPHGGHQCHFGGLSAIEGGQVGIVSAALTAAIYKVARTEARPPQMRSAVLAAIAIHWGDADEGGDRAPVERPQFRQLGEQRPRGNRPDPRHAAQHILLHPPHGTGLNRRPDLVVHVADPPFEPANVIAQVAGDPRLSRALQQMLQAEMTNLEPEDEPVAVRE